MFHVLALYDHPADLQAFRRHYEDTHTKIALSLPDVARYTVTWCGPGPDGSDPAFALVASLYWETEEAAMAALAGPAGEAAMADLPHFAGAGVTMLLARSEVRIPFATGRVDGRETYALFGVYNVPADPAHFEKHHREVHAGLGMQMPGVASFTMNWVQPSPDGTPAPYHFVAAMQWESREAMLESMGSPETAAAVDDLPNFAGAGQVMVFGPTVQEI